MQQAISLLMRQWPGSCVQWVLESLVRLGAENTPSPSKPLGRGGAIILKVICIVPTHPPLPKWFIFSPHNHSSKNSTTCVCGGSLYFPQSLTTVDLLTLFLDLRMNRITGISEAVISRWQDTRRRGIQLTQSFRCFTYVFKYDLSWGFMKSAPEWNIWLFHLHRRHLLFFFCPSPSSSNFGHRILIALGKPALLWAPSLLRLTPLLSSGYTCYSGW